jgi:cytoskeletal protein RodZ
MKSRDFRPGSTETVGAFLQAERQQRGITLEEVAEGTGISAAVLSTLEEDDRERLPAEVYTRAFYRKYAVFLALDPGELLTRYQPKPQVLKKEGSRANFSTSITLKGQEENRIAGLLRRLFLPLVFLAAGGLLYWLYKKYLAAYNPFGFL